jgi:DNA-binding NarL/FixJ family response regulator
MLSEILQIGIVSQASDIYSAWKAITDLHPSLVLLDTSLGHDEVISIVNRLVKVPQCRSLVLTDTVHQKTEIKAAGADIVLIKGFPAEKLYGALVQLLSVQEVNVFEGGSA